MKRGASTTRANGHKAATLKVTTLKVVGFSDDGAQLVLARRAGAKTGEFRIAVDQALVDAVKAATRRGVEVAEAMVSEAAAKSAAEANGSSHGPAESAPVVRPNSKLSPKEIQALLRRGVAPATIARRAEVDVSWVERFHGPILWERAGMVGRAQKATLTKARRGPSGEPLLESIAACLRARRIDPSAVSAGTWDAVRRPKKNAWVVTFTYTNKGREQRASWEYDPAAGEIVALNRLGAEIGWVQAARRKRAS